MKSLGYICAFLGGAIAGTALGLLVAPEAGTDLDKHNIKLSRKEVADLVDEIKEAAPENIVD